MGNLRTLQILEQVLGKSKHNSHTGEVGFHCPFCKHHKRKFNIHIETEKWQCWVCSAKGRTIASLFRKLNVSQEIMNRLSKIVGKVINAANSKNMMIYLCHWNIHHYILPTKIVQNIKTLCTILQKEE